MRVVRPLRAPGNLSSKRPSAATFHSPGPTGVGHKGGAPGSALLTLCLLLFFGNFLLWHNFKLMKNYKKNIKNFFYPDSPAIYVLAHLLYHPFSVHVDAGYRRQCISI